MFNKLQPYLYWIMLAFLAVGYFYPAIGVLALICMLAPVAVAAWRGRYWCGNWCPRGSFYDHVLSRISPHRPAPRLLKSRAWRLFMVLFILTVFTVQMYFAWGRAAAVGLVFIRLIVLTTLAGMILAVFYHERTWCNFCPMGTMASWLSKRRLPLEVTDDCARCGLCSRACPLGLTPYDAENGLFSHPDCLKCGRCIAACPRRALQAPSSLPAPSSRKTNAA